MNIKGKSYESIIVTNDKDEVIAVITDDDVIENEGYKVILEPTKEDLA